MDSKQLTYAQLVALNTHINAAVRATQSIVNRMQELKFAKDDPLYAAVWKANSGNTSLSILITALAGEAKWRETGPAVKEWDSKRKQRGGR